MATSSRLLEASKVDVKVPQPRDSEDASQARKRRRRDAATRLRAVRGHGAKVEAAAARAGRVVAVGGVVGAVAVLLLLRAAAEDSP